MTTVGVTEIQPALLKIIDAARYLGMSDSAFRALIRDGEVEVVKLPHADRAVRRADLDALVERFAERAS